MYLLEALNGAGNGGTTVDPTLLHRIVPLADLPAYCGLHRTQIGVLVARGEFPQPVKLSTRRKGWLETELIAWQQARIARRDTKAVGK
jgi:prophage regulatory protein